MDGRPWIKTDKNLLTPFVYHTGFHLPSVGSPPAQASQARPSSDFIKDEVSVNYSEELASKGRQRHGEEPRLRRPETLRSLDSSGGEI